MDEMQRLMKEAEKSVTNAEAPKPNRVAPQKQQQITPQYPRKALICPHCGTIGGTKNDIKGNIGTEILLWCLCLLPGICYSIWRLTTKKKVCYACRAEGMIPLNSPMGQKLLKDFGDKQTR